MQAKYNTVAIIAVLLAYLLSFFANADPLNGPFTVLGLLMILSLLASFILRSHYLGAIARYFFIAVLAQGVLAMISSFFAVSLLALQILPLHLAFPASYLVLAAFSLAVSSLKKPRLRGLLAIVSLPFLFSFSLVPGNLGIAFVGIFALLVSPTIYWVFTEKIPEELEQGQKTLSKAS